ncbi:T9SS type A sorting domain-containing protein [Xanthomarina spongicola]|uniref:Putative secreted protein (Por secretion system target) n=1 Tax=Xanthomarina spongicola TaxID=570520 RepID=A0A316DNP5_9FLAO|nr:T9SS type A sorting domain-containing protein [Xanthomarina spongicola]PWK19158.1 putative secreted protein (Por secretion system target) [Xanthomarina spongicola]
MKNIYLLSLLLLSVSVFSQNKKNALQKFDVSDMETSVLIPSSPITNLDVYNEKTVTNYSFYQAYKAIVQGDLENRYFPLDNLKEQSKQSYFTNVIPLVILHSEYESISNLALQNNAVTKDSEGYLIRNGNASIFEKKHITLTTPLRSSSKGLQTTFKLSDSNIFNTTNQIIEHIEIDFNDGSDFRNIILNQNIVVNYTEAGKKTITFKLTFENGDVITRQSRIDIKYSNADLFTNYNRVITTFNSSITPDLLPYGEAVSYPGTGEYEMYLSADNILDKPIFLVDGFDPGDGRDITGLYNLLNFDDDGSTSNLGDLVRAEGFDVVILNFPIYTRTADAAVIDGGVDFIERNAMLLVELINTINTQKVGTAENVIIGPSMGGLISRYALNFMEDQNMSHETRLWISFDAPHHGANVPIGFQHQFNFLAFGLDDFLVLGDLNVEELQPIIDGMLKSSAARQMLTDQFEPHITDSDGVTFNSSLALPRAHPFKAILDGRMNSLTSSGFPELTRNVTIINGSGSNNRYPDNTAGMNDLVPGSQIVNANIELFGVAELKANTFFTPTAGSEIEMSQIHLDFPWWFPLANDRINNADSRAFTYSNGVDAASGGLFDIIKLTEDLSTDGLVGEFLASLSTDYFNFIPSISSMAFEITNEEIDWFHTPTGVTTARATTNITPFDAWYMPIDNEPHVTLTEGNVAFALNEIFQETLSIESNLESFIKLKQNPITDNLTILSSQFFEEANITILDMTGKFVYNKKTSLNESTNIPLNLSSGIYVLNIETNSQQNFRTKVIIK